MSLLLLRRPSCAAIDRVKERKNLVFIYSICKLSEKFTNIRIYLLYFILFIMRMNVFDALFHCNCFFLPQVQLSECGCTIRFFRRFFMLCKAKKKSCTDDYKLSHLMYFKIAPQHKMSKINSTGFHAQRSVVYSGTDMSKTSQLMEIQEIN